MKTTETDWHEARRILRKDERYEQADLLDRDAKQALFDQHLK